MNVQDILILIFNILFVGVLFFEIINYLAVKMLECTQWYTQTGCWGFFHHVLQFITLR